MTNLVNIVTKVGKTRRIRQILDRGIGPVAEIDRAWLTAEIFPGHPRWSEKCSGGVVSVNVKLMPPYNSRCFFIKRTDGSEVDISFRECLNPSSHSAKVRAAARDEVMRDMAVWRIKNPSPDEGLHVDHVEPFDGIWREFCEKYEINEEHISVISAPVGREDYFENRKLAHSWARFHFLRANLQWLEASENIRKSNRTEGEHAVIR